LVPWDGTAFHSEMRVTFLLAIHCRQLDEFRTDI
jgi:hypothetical protein